jgi:hypothetical protein
MVGILMLLTGWGLLSPLLVLLFAGLTGFYAAWMQPFIDIAGSIPLLVFFTLGGIVMIFLGVRRLSQANDPIGPR